MRREFLFATVLAAALSMGVSAQSGTGQPGQAGQGGTMAQGTPGGTEKQAKDQNVTVTGCIQSGSQASPGTAGAAGTSGSSTAGSATSSSDTMGKPGSASSASRSSADQFVLTNVTGAPAALSGIDRVTLSGKDSDLKKHVGHKVQITGKWESNSGSGSSSGYGSSSSPAGTSGSSGTLKVSSVKMLAESCSQ